MHWLGDIDKSILLFFNGSGSGFIDVVAVTLTSGVLWIPLYIVLLYIVIKNNDTMPQVMLAVGGALLCVAVTAGFTELLVKPLVGRLRPCSDPCVKYSLDLVHGTCLKSFSFFSAHAANTFGIAVYFSCLVRSRLLSFVLIVWSLVNCWTRLYLGVHYPSDIVCGLIFGALAGFSAYCFYRRLYLRIAPVAVHRPSKRHTSSGYAVSDIDIVLNVFAFILFYVTVKAMILQ